MATDRTVTRLAVCLLLCAGCASPQGFLYTRTTVPFYLPPGNVVRKGEKSCRIDITQLKEPLSQANLTVIWTSQAVAEASVKAGLTDLRYADIETFSVLNRVFERRRLIFYGD